VTPPQLTGIGSQGPSVVPQNPFLTKYDYSGKKRQDPKTAEEADITPRHLRKRPSPEVIDLTETPDKPDNPAVSSRREGKRRKFDVQGRGKRRRSHTTREEKRHRDRQQPSQPLDQQSRQEIISGSQQESRRQPNREIPHIAQNIPQVGDEKGQQALPLQNGQEIRQAPVQGQSQEPIQPPRPDTQLKPSSELLPRTVPGIQQRPIRSQLGHDERGRGQSIEFPSRNDREIVNAIKNRPVNAGDKARRRVEQLKAKHPPTNNPSTKNPSTAGGHLSVSSLENDTALFEKFSSKVPEKRTAQLVSRVPGHNNHLEPNSYRRASQRAEPLLPVAPVDQHIRLPLEPTGNLPVTQVPHLPSASAQGGTRQTSQLPQSRNIFQPKPVHQRFNPQPRSDIPLNQTIVPPPPTHPRPSLNQVTPQHPPPETTPPNDAHREDRGNLQFRV